MTLDRMLALADAGELRVPASVAWFLEDIGYARGRQDLFTQQSPQVLRRLREHAIVESAVSSNRIEGVEVEPARVGPVVMGRAALRDRDEIEVRGYREALARVHEHAPELPVSADTIRGLHLTSRGGLGDAGEFKTRDTDIVERSASGATRVRFRTVPAAAAPAAVTRLVEQWQAWSEARTIVPLVAVAAWNLDFLCVHPFRDGNGRVSRLLLVLQCHQLGYDVGRYISLERLIEDHKARYYETLELASAGWHEGTNDSWPYIGFIVFVLRQAYREFEERVGDVRAPRGSKTARVLAGIAGMPGAFSVAQLQRRCPGVGIDLIRRVLKQERAARRMSCSGRGPAATWRRIAG